MGLEGIVATFAQPELTGDEVALPELRYHHVPRQLKRIRERQEHRR